MHDTTTSQQPLSEQTVSLGTGKVLAVGAVIAFAQGMMALPPARYIIMAAAFAIFLVVAFARSARLREGGVSYSAFGRENYIRYDDVLEVKVTKAGVVVLPKHGRKMSLWPVSNPKEIADEIERRCGTTSQHQVAA